MRRCIPATVVPALLAILAGCDGGPAEVPKPTGPPGITIVSGSGAADSIQAVLPPLIVEVRDDEGQLVSGTAVEFFAELVPNTRTPRLYIHTDQPASHRAQALTDANGRATLRIAMGAFIGPTTISIGAPSLGLSATAEYYVGAGAAVRMEVAPRDTLLHPGAGFTPRITIRDRHGNLTSTPVTLTPASAALSASGTSVRAETFGRTFVRLAAGTLRDSIGVSVVPRATLAVLATYDIHLVQTDGSGRRAVLRDARNARWLADGESVVFTDAGLGIGRLRRINTVTGATASLPAGDEMFARDADPHPAPTTGDWIYFTRYLDPYGRVEKGSTLWRVRADGTGATIVPGFVADSSALLGNPSPSPDGTRVAYHSRPGSVYVAAVGTGTVLAQAAGQAPEWSPAGDWIAFTSGGALRVMRPDGSGIRTVAEGQYLPGLDWSPDGEWVVAGSHRGLDLVHVQTGAVIPLPFSAGMSQPAWKP